LKETTEENQKGAIILETIKEETEAANEELRSVQNKSLY
jgi:hypothetical protein